LKLYLKINFSQVLRKIKNKKNGYLKKKKKKKIHMGKKRNGSTFRFWKQLWIVTLYRKNTQIFSVNISVQI